MRVEAGDRLVLLRAVEIAPESLLKLQPGDVGQVVGATETRCAARFHGKTVVVPLDWVQPLPA